MNIPWTDKRCITCLETKPLNTEHIIPAALSGKLTAKFLCVRCNSKLGETIDHSACSEPRIRQAAFAMEGIPFNKWVKINQKVGNNQKVIVRMGGREIKGKTKGKTLKITPFRNEIGELVRSIQLDDSVTIHPVGKPIKSLLLLKIAYEFLALCLGTAIYGNEPELARVRKTLITLDEKNAFVEIFPREEKYHVHGIAFEGNNPFASIQVRLFGSLAFRVNFPEIALGGIRFAYTHDLSTGKEDVVDRDHVKRKTPAKSLPKTPPFAA